jgi:hypothetical protein
VPILSPERDSATREGLVSSIKIELTEEETDWLAACLGLVMEIARHWDNRTATDVGNRLLAKLTLAKVVGVGMDPDGA